MAQRPTQMAWEQSFLLEVSRLRAYPCRHSLSQSPVYSRVWVSYCVSVFSLEGHIHRFFLKSLFLQECPTLWYYNMLTSTDVLSHINGSPGMHAGWMLQAGHSDRSRARVFFPLWIPITSPMPWNIDVGVWMCSSTCLSCTFRIHCEAPNHSIFSLADFTGCLVGAKHCQNLHWLIRWQTCVLWGL